MGNLQNFAKKATEKKSENSLKSSKINRKSVLFGILKEEILTKDEITIKAAIKYFTILKKDPKTQQEFDKMDKSMGDAFDTMKSNYNFKDKIDGDKLLSGTKWYEPQTGHYTIK